MCGIAGIVDFDVPSYTHAAELLRMQQLLRHRGPDGGQVVHAGPVGLAFTRLAIVSDHPRSLQPIEHAGHWLVFNGEIVDWPELARELEVRATCDAEVLLHALIRWGEDALPRLNGMFAFAWYDGARRRGILARDALGVKPLVYREGATLQFASEARALGGELDPDAVQDWVCVPQLSHEPPQAGVVALPAGHLLRFNERGTALVRWFEWEADPEEIDPEALAHTLQTAFAQWGHARLPVDCFLSGGLDSTAVAALCRPDRAVTVALAGQSSFRGDAIVRDDDHPHAVAVAKALHLPLHTVRPDRSLRAIREVAQIDDRLPSWEQQVTQHHLAAAVQDRVVLVGDAADETWHGYDFLIDKEGDDLLAFFGSFRRAKLLRRPLRPRLEGNTTTLIRERWLARLLHNGDVHTMAHGVEARVPFADPRVLRFARVQRDGRDKRQLRRALSGRIPERGRLRRKSALPRDQGAEGLYRRGLAELRLEAVDPWLDGAAIRRLRERSTWDEIDRAMAFSVLALEAWVDAHLGGGTIDSVMEEVVPSRRYHGPCTE